MSDKRALIELLTLARQYLNHPDVTRIPFALSSQVIADRLQLAIDELDPRPVDKLLQGYEKLGESRPLIQPNQYGRRSAFDTAHGE